MAGLVVSSRDQTVSSTEISRDLNPGPSDSEGGLMRADTYRQIVFFCLFVNSAISPLGIVFNIINIVVFCKLGFKESTNIILVSLAVTDICILMTLLGLTLNANLMIMGGANFDILAAVAYIVLGWPNVLTTRISGCLTTYLTFERFLCVVLPLRVKTILQKKTALTFIIALCLFSMAYSVPMYLANSIGLRFNPMSNQTSVGLTLSENSDVLEGVSRSINITVELTSFILVISFTSGLIYSYNITARWRNKASTITENSHLSKRDRKLVKMVLCISIVFIGCSLPFVTVDVVMLLVKEFNTKGHESFLFIATCSIFSNLSSVNSAVNIFIYLKMSSKFRNAFKETFHVCKHRDDPRDVKPNHVTCLLFSSRQ